MRRFREDKELVEDYGERIKRAREAKGLSREDLARLVGIKVSTLRSIENQDFAPDVETAEKLEKILGIKLFQEVSDADNAASAAGGSVRGADILAFRSRREEVKKKKKKGD